MVFLNKIKRPIKVIEKEIIKNKLEDLNLIKKIEANLKKSTSFNLKKEENVVILLSGGLDSIITWGILLDEFKCNVYPLFLNRKQKKYRNELRSINFYSNLYKKRYKSQFQEIFILNTPIPPEEIRWDILKFSNKKIKKNSKQWYGIPLYTNIMISYAVQYVYFLRLIKNIKINKIFTGLVKTDGEVMKYETLTSIRIINFLINNLTNEKFLISALPIEKEMGLYLSKKDLIIWASNKKIPLKYTWSCNQYLWYHIFLNIHCGKCLYCNIRKDSFKKANKEDKTIYLNDFNFLWKLKKIIKKYFFI